MSDRMMDNLKAVGGTVATWTGTVAAWQTQVEWFFRVGASIGAILVAFYTVRSILRKERKGE